ncbi:neuropeptide S [Ornithorhynchus anatinus]|uniref:Neuropeptide S n=1 Tax=Ornithorhynchus anatinus TaxID=9258 RepID=A0A6I8P2U1_ORNAN|nr:neuropeptide S [Ornithorhynchus anatinus]
MSLSDGGGGLTFSSRPCPGYKGTSRDGPVEASAIEIEAAGKMRSFSRFTLVLVLWLSAVHGLWSHPMVYAKLSGRSDHFLVLLSHRLATVDRNGETALLKPYLEKTFMRRSFRNGVGQGIKKTSFRRAKS